MAGRSSVRSPLSDRSSRRPSWVATLDASLIGVIVGAVVLPSPWSGPVGVIGLAVGVAAWRERRDLAAASLFASASVAVAMALPFGWVWPIPPAVALVGFVLLVGRDGRLGVRSWCRFGHADRRAIGVALASVPLSTVALVAFIASARTDLERVSSPLQGLPIAVVVLVGCGFAVVNPMVEEVLFRGLLQPALRANGASVALAVTLQAAAFGALHLDGVPGGPSGMAMAAGWGAMLGYVRHRTDGLGLVWLVHVVANTTMYTAVVVLARADGVL